MMQRLKPEEMSRRNFFTRTGCGAVALSTTGTVLTSTVLRADDRPVDAGGRVIAGFENNEQVDLEEADPADVIAEGVAHTRGWFAGRGVAPLA